MARPSPPGRSYAPTANPCAVGALPLRGASRWGKPESGVRASARSIEFPIRGTRRFGVSTCSGRPRGLVGRGRPTRAGEGWDRDPHTSRSQHFGEPCGFPSRTFVLTTAASPCHGEVRRSAGRSEAPRGTTSVHRLQIRHMTVGTAAHAGGHAAVTPFVLGSVKAWQFLGGGLHAKYCNVGVPRGHQRQTTGTHR